MKTNRLRQAIDQPSEKWLRDVKKIKLLMQLSFTKLIGSQETTLTFTLTKPS
ncbi:MAG: hypothetical protein QXH91_04080 [Candidatus Bathyarchaeia archaeon]